MEFLRRRAVRLALAGLAALTPLLVAVGRSAAERPADPEPDFVVEVLNGTSRSGLARQVTRLLREEGIDVVYFGSAPEKVDSTLVLVRRGEPARGHRIARLLGTRTVTLKPDPKRHVDVTVILGADYRLPKDRLPL